MYIKRIVLSLALIAMPAFAKLNPGVHYINSLVQRTENVEDAFNRIIKENPNVLVDFYAEWCGPCKRLGAALPNVARAFPTLVILKVDVDGPQCDKITRRFSVSSIPAVLCFKNGNMMQRINGFNGESDFINKLRKIY